MQVSDLMQRINFTMPKFKDDEKRVLKQGQEIFCKIFNCLLIRNMRNQFSVWRPSVTS